MVASKRIHRTRKVDANQSDIVKELKAYGFSVAITSDLGHGFPDLVVGKYDKNFLIEIKNGSLCKSSRKLTSAEQDFVSGWRGQYCVIESVADVARLNADLWAAS